MHCYDLLCFDMSSCACLMLAMFGYVLLCLLCFPMYCYDLLRVAVLSYLTLCLVVFYHVLLRDMFVLSCAVTIIL